MAKHLTSFLILSSALAVAVLCNMNETRAIFPLSLITRGLFVLATFAHEIGHTIFYWLFGQPAVPMIMTIFGSDQAGGFTMPLYSRTWVMQAVSIGALIYGCYWVKTNRESWLLFISAVIFSSFIAAMAFTDYYEAIISYMGHGGSILVGGFLLYRAWPSLDFRNNIERWLSALSGFYLILNNFMFSYGLNSNIFLRRTYTEHVAFGISHNDFQAMTDIIYGWSVPGIAIFTMILCVVIVIISLIYAFILQDGFDDWDA